MIRAVAFALLLTVGCAENPSSDDDDLADAAPTDGAPTDAAPVCEGGMSLVYHADSCGVGAPMFCAYGGDAVGCPGCSCEGETVTIGCNGESRFPFASVGACPGDDSGL